MNGILIINKPKGISSFHYMKKVQRKLGLAKVGHLGTLDPNASGVLVLLCGNATKLNDKLSGRTGAEGNFSKIYQSEFRFGIETDTLDPEGKIIATSDIIPTREQIMAILPHITGQIEIEIPKFSAVHIDGKRAYDLARKGIDFDAPVKTVAVNRFELISSLSRGGNLPPVTQPPTPASFFVEIECETGTYIRSLAKLLAQKLGTLAIAQEITRTAVGDFKIENAKTLEDVTFFDLIQP